MCKKEIDKYADEMLKRIDEKDGKSLKRLKIFSFVLLLFGLEIINFMILQMNIEPLIMILIVDLFVLAISVTQHKVGTKTGLDIGKSVRKLDRLQYEKTEALLWKRMIELRDNKSGE